MIVHEVKIGKGAPAKGSKPEHKHIFVGCARADIRYRDMLVNFRQRWEFYTRHTISFRTIDPRGRNAAPDPAVEKIIKESNGVMMIVSAHTAKDRMALWQIDCAVSHHIPIAGIDIGQNPEGRIPDQLAGKMTRYGWEWFALFINEL